MALKRRSERDRVNNTTYADLPMTHYPAGIDSRDSANTHYNPNMQGFLNVQDAKGTEIPDYVMAEHVNALADAVMAIQRTLGVFPQKDKNGVNKGTVSNRIKALEEVNYDLRYGGVGWDPSQTIVAHKHDGRAGHPSKIDLTKEVQNKLPRNNIDLTAATGLTGQDIMISRTSTTKISDAINDKLSTSQGGTVKADLSVTGRFASTLMREWDYRDAAQGTTIVSDSTASLGQAIRISGTSGGTFINKTIPGIRYGKYVIGVRAKINSTATDGPMIRVSVYNSNNTQYQLAGSNTLYAKDFPGPGEWHMLYLIVNIKGNGAAPILRVSKETTTASITADVDYVFMMPVHPAIFDK